MTIVEHIFATKKEKLKCSQCQVRIPKGGLFVAESETEKGTCFNCSAFVSYTFLPTGDAALTRRSKKYSTRCGILMVWNPRRKRFERKGQYVEQAAIDQAKMECLADQDIRQVKNKKAAIKRAEADKIYIQNFALAIRKRYPSCPIKREFEIAGHACEKHSGRVGRTANAKQFDNHMIDLAVEAHIRHKETNYDQQFGSGKRKREIRSNVKFDIQRIMVKWKQPLKLE